MISLVSFIIPALVVLLVLKLIALPFKILIKVGINIFLGGLIIFGLSLIGITITLTWWMAAIVGILGIPGAIIAIILSFVL